MLWGRRRWASCGGWVASQCWPRSSPAASRPTTSGCAATTTTAFASSAAASTPRREERSRPRSASGRPTPTSSTTSASATTASAWPTRPKKRTASVCASADHADCLHALTAFLVHQPRRGDADKLVEDWLRREPTSAATYAEYGWLCARDKNYPKALDVCQHAYELDPRDVHTLNQLGRLYETVHRRTGARAMSEHSLEVRPDQPEVGALVSRLKADGAGPPHPD